MEDSGKGVYTEKKIEPGEVLFRDSPVISAQTIDSAKVSPACSQCSRSLLEAAFYFRERWATMSEKQKGIVQDHWPVVKTTSCPHCNRETYCSNVCLETAWRQHHQFLCPATNSVAKELFDFCDKGENIVKGMWNSVFSPMMLARIWASMTSVAKLGMVEDMLEEPTKEHWKIASMPYHK